MLDGPQIDRSRLIDLFEREVDRIFGYLVSRCGSRVLAEDLTAEAFAAATRHCAAGHGDEVTGAWLQTVAQRRLVDHWRREGARRRAVDRLIAAVPAAPPDSKECEDAVDLALASLPARHRAALVLRYMDGFSTSEVADALDVSYKAAESMLSRARRSFERAYGGCNDQSPG